jgi:hypothetical protein
VLKGIYVFIRQLREVVSVILPYPILINPHISKQENIRVIVIMIEIVQLYDSL